MTVLTIFAHPCSKSFCHTVRALRCACKRLGTPIKSWTRENNSGAPETPFAIGVMNERFGKDLYRYTSAQLRVGGLIDITQPPDPRCAVIP